MIQLILRFYFYKNNIPKTASSFPNNNTLNNIIIHLPSSSNSINPVLKYIILSLYIIGSPEIVTKGYRSSFYLCGNLNYLIISGDMWFLITLLSTIALNFVLCHLACKFKY